MNFRLAIALVLAAVLVGCSSGGASDAELLKPKDLKGKTQRPDGSSNTAQTEPQL